jgi:hypothetical protein
MSTGKQVGTQEGPHHYCRNPNCRSLMAEPVENANAGFCCAGCFERYHRTRCVICERPLQQPKTGGAKYLCGRRTCRMTYLENPRFYRPFSHRFYEPATLPPKRSQSIQKVPGFIESKSLPEHDRGSAFEQLRGDAILSDWKPHITLATDMPPIPGFLQRPLGPPHQPCARCGKSFQPGTWKQSRCPECQT